MIFYNSNKNCKIIYWNYKKLNIQVNITDIKNKYNNGTKLLGLSGLFYF